MLEWYDLTLGQTWAEAGPFILVAYDNGWDSWIHVEEKDIRIAWSEDSISMEHAQAEAEAWYDNYIDSWPGDT